MFIDIHTHCYRHRPPCIRFSTPEQLIRRYDKMKVDVAVILPIVNPEIYLPQSVDEVIEICHTYPDRFVVQGFGLQGCGRGDAHHGSG